MYRKSSPHDLCYTMSQVFKSHTISLSDEETKTEIMSWKYCLLPQLSNFIYVYSKMFFLVTDHNALVLICVCIRYKTHIRLLFFTLCWITSLCRPGTKVSYEKEGCPAPWRIRPIVEEREHWNETMNKRPLITLSLRSSPFFPRCKWPPWTAGNLIKSSGL